MPSPTLTGFTVRIVVGIADMATSNNRDAILTTYSLGSCLGISVYDPVVKVGGLLHIMLPDSTIDSEKARNKPAMFADTGVPMLFRETYQFHAQKNRMIICVAGGAQVMDTTGFFNIGKRNYEAIKQIFDRNGLKIHAEQVGGLVSRSMYLHLETGEVRLKISGQPNDFILCKT